VSRANSFVVILSASLAVPNSWQPSFFVQLSPLEEQDDDDKNVGGNQLF